MSAPLLHLTITTPMAALVEVRTPSVRAEDASGGFGLWPGHVDLLTALPASVVRWRDVEGGAWHFCALRGGLLSVRDGAEVAIACREGVLGRDLAELAGDVAAFRAREAGQDRDLRVEQTRLHAQAVRQMMRYLRPDRPGLLSHPPRIQPGQGAQR